MTSSGKINDNYGSLAIVSMKILIQSRQIIPVTKQMLFDVNDKDYSLEIAIRANIHFAHCYESHTITGTSTIHIQSLIANFKVIREFIFTANYTHMTSCILQIGKITF